MFDEHGSTSAREIRLSDYGRLGKSEMKESIPTNDERIGKTQLEVTSSTTKTWVYPVSDITDDSLVLMSSMLRGGDYYPKPCTIANGEPCSPCLEAAALEDAIHNLEKSLATLKTKRRPLRQRINQLHDPFSSHLPPEIASNIFMTFLPEDLDSNYSIFPPYNTSITPLRLGAVSQAWRTIAWSTPLLWASLSIDMYNKNVETPKLIRDWLDRSDQLPLHIQLYGKERPGSRIPWGDEPHLNPLINAIVAYASRWLYLDMQLPKWIMMRVRCTSPVPLMLNTLKLDLPYCGYSDDQEYFRRGEKINLNAIISPAEVVIRELGIAPIDIEWNNVTHVTACFFSINECFELLQKAPQMTHFALSGINGKRRDFPIPQTVVQHRRLSFLDITYDVRMGINIFLERTSFPALKTWKHRTGKGALPINDIIAHIARSSCRLNSMMLSQYIETVDSDELVKLLRATPSLEHLALRCIPDDPDMNYFDPFLRLLSTSVREQGVESALFLPHLKALDITGVEAFSWDHIPGIFGFDHDPSTPILSRESEARIANHGPLCSLRVIVDHSEEFRTPIDLDIIRLLIPLMRQGIKLQIVGARYRGRRRYYHDILGPSIDFHKRALQVDHPPLNLPSSKHTYVV
ncbi:hypothetical protein BDZ97DRAFT_1762291 [Flammula alnicola]|nr:hypothetical protein BDZ97DRAFT_1762291 [Flammula alnicola]